MKTSQLSLSQTIALVLSECRGAWRRFAFFILCIAIGVGAVMMIQSLSALLDHTVGNQSKSLLAADIAIKGSWQQNEKDLAYQKQALPAGTGFVFVKELHAMARHHNKNAESRETSLLVELKAVPATPPLYPLYGTLETEPAAPLAALLANHGAVVEAGFLLRTGLKPGETFLLGNQRVTITATVVSEPDRISRAFSIGPRVFVSHATLKAADLIRPGSRVKHRHAHQTPRQHGAGAWARNFKTRPHRQIAAAAHVQGHAVFPHRLHRTHGPVPGCGRRHRAHHGRHRRRHDHPHFHGRQKLDTIAILNCVGASSTTVFRVYLIQALFLGLVGSLLGLAIGYAVLYLVPAKLAGLLNLEVQPRFYWLPALQSLTLGMATTLLFCLWPLLRAVKTRPLRLFRRNFEEEELSSGSRRERLFMGIFLVAGLSAMIFWQAGSIKRGAVFLCALAVSALIFRLVSALLLKTLKKLPPARSMTRRYGLANLYRPNNQAASIITCIGMGIMLVLTVRLVQMDMLAMLKANTEIDPPNYFFIDIQADQKDKFITTLDTVAPEAKRDVVPLIRSRLHSADGKKTADWQYKNPQQEEWFIKRNFVLTYMQGAPPKDNEIVEGTWWSEDQASVPQVSLEEDAARRLGVKIGSTITMDIQGIHITAPVTSIRKVNWRNMRTNFYMIFSPGALKGAPITFVATVHVPAEKELTLQQAMADALPNVTALSTRDIVNTIESVVEKLKTLVDFMSGFSILAGLFILSGSVASTKFRRMKESAVLKILGAQRKKVAGILGVEYATLGLVAGILGVGLSAALSWAVMKYLVKAGWHPYPGIMLWAIALTVLGTTLTGIVSSLDVLKNKPIRTLRGLGA